MQHCPRCNKDKEDHLFYRSRSSDWCKSCTSIYYKEHYVKNKVRIDKRIADYQRRKNEEGYCVYVHKLDDKVFYAGQGTKKRANQTVAKSRSAKYSAFVSDRQNDIEVQIICKNCDKRTALMLEANLIYELQPVCNIGV